MRQIKFRGRRLDNGQFVYGDFVHYVPQSSFPGIVDEDGFVHEVESDSVAQLVGRDVNGKEVYEGDILTDEKGFTYEAALQSSVEWQNEKDLGAPKAWRGMPFAFAKAFAKLTLKEAKS